MSFKNLNFGYPLDLHRLRAPGSLTWTLEKKHDAFRYPGDVKTHLIYAFIFRLENGHDLKFNRKNIRKWKISHWTLQKVTHITVINNFSYQK